MLPHRFKVAASKLTMSKSQESSFSMVWAIRGGMSFNDRGVIRWLGMWWGSVSGRRQERKRSDEEEEDRNVLFTSSGQQVNKMFQMNIIYELQNIKQNRFDFIIITEWKTSETYTLRVVPPVRFVWTYVLWKGCIRFLTVCVNRPVTEQTERQCQGRRQQERNNDWIHTIHLLWTGITAVRKQRGPMDCLPDTFTPTCMM